MLVMVSNATGVEVGLLAGKYPGRIGHLFSPGGQRGPWREIPHAFDNSRFPQWETEQRAKKRGLVAPPGTSRCGCTCSDGESFAAFRRSGPRSRIALLIATVHCETGSDTHRS